VHSYTFPFQAPIFLNFDGVLLKLTWMKAVSPGAGALPSAGESVEDMRTTRESKKGTAACVTGQCRPHARGLHSFTLELNLSSSRTR
jgi:hypothetical protein